MVADRRGPRPRRLASLTGSTDHGHCGQGAGRFTDGNGEARVRTGRGPTEPEAHREYSGEVGIAGGGLAAAESTAAASDICGGDGGGDLRRPSSIPSTGRSCGTRRGSSAWRRSLGWRGMAAESGGHGSDLGRAWGEKQRRERELAGEGKRREGTSWRRAVSPGGRLGGLGGKQEVATAAPGSSTQVLRVPGKKTRSTL
jgi:hypothetical protein